MAANRLSQLRDFLWAKARENREWVVGGRPNGAAIAEDLGVSVATISRALRGVRNTVPEEERQRSERAAKLSPQMEEALMEHFGFDTPEELYEEMAATKGEAPELI